MSRLVIFSALSGLFWTLIVFALGNFVLDRFGFWVIPPGIATGLFIGLLSIPVYQSKRRWMNSLWAVASLFLSAACFGIMIFPLHWVVGTELNAHHPVKLVLALWWGLVFLGFCTFLAPLAFLNHRFIARQYWAAESSSSESSL